MSDCYVSDSESEAAFFDALTSPLSTLPLSPPRSRATKAASRARRLAYGERDSDALADLARDESRLASATDAPALMESFVHRAQDSVTLGKSTRRQVDDPEGVDYQTRQSISATTALDELDIDELLAACLAPAHSVEFNLQVTPPRTSDTPALRIVKNSRGSPNEEQEVTLEDLERTPRPQDANVFDSANVTPKPSQHFSHVRQCSSESQMMPIAEFPMPPTREDELSYASESRPASRSRKHDSFFIFQDDQGSSSDEDEPAPLNSSEAALGLTRSPSSSSALDTLSSNRSSRADSFSGSNAFRWSSNTASTGVTSPSAFSHKRTGSDTSDGGFSDIIEETESCRSSFDWDEEVPATTTPLRRKRSILDRVRMRKFMKSKDDSPPPMPKSALPPLPVAPGMLRSKTAPSQQLPTLSTLKSVPPLPSPTEHQRPRSTGNSDESKPRTPDWSSFITELFDSHNGEVTDSPPRPVRPELRGLKSSQSIGSLRSAASIRRAVSKMTLDAELPALPLPARTSSLSPRASPKASGKALTSSSAANGLAII